MRLARWVVLLPWLITSGGCTSDSVENQVAGMNRSNIQRVANLYGAHLAMRGWQGPKDEAEFRSFITSGQLAAKNLEMMGVDPKQLDVIFKSDRDGKPYKIRYGLTTGRGTPTAVAFEQVGVNGKRLVGYTNSKTEEADEARYKELWEGRGQPTK